MRTEIIFFRRLLSVILTFIIAAILAQADVLALNKDDPLEMPVGGWEPLEVHELKEAVDIENPSEGPVQERNVFNAKDGSVFTDGVTDVGYNALTSNGLRNFYKKFDQEATAFMNATTDLKSTRMSGSTVYVVAQINFSSLGISSRNEAMKAFCAYDYDHPAYYWISNSVWYDNNSIYVITEPEYASVSERARINELVEAGVKEYAKLAESTTDTLDKISFVHDRMVSDVDYAYNSSGNPESAKWAHSVHGVFDPKHYSVVCEGYADAFSLILNYLDIPNYYIVGMAVGSSGNRGGHAWNAASYDGGKTYIYMDLTWDDDGEEDGYDYMYFGLPKSDFETRHEAYTSSNSGLSWLYDLKGTFNDSVDGMYYKKAGFYYDGSGSASDFAKKIRTKAARVGESVAFLSNNTSNRSSVVSGLGGGAKGTSGSIKGTTYYQAFKRIYPSNVDLSGATIELEDEYEYTGQAVKPEVKVVLNGITLLKDYNYKVSYSNNINQGTATVTVTGTDNFTGTASAQFDIYDSSSHVHAWSEPSYSWTEDNSKCTATRSCSAAHCRVKTETETVNSTSQVTKTATCTEAGEKEYTATFKNSAFATQKKKGTVAATGHSYGNAAYTWADDNSTCTATKTCANDSTHKVTETVNTTSRVSTAATCTTKGKTTYTAQFTNSEFTTQTKTVEDIAAKGHSYGEPTYSWTNNNSRCTATRVCANDSSHKETENATASSQVTKAATCTEAGEREYTATFTNTAFATQKKTETIAATGHSFGSVTYTWSEDNSKCTATRTCSKDASHKETETVNTTSSVTTAATCTTKGKTTYTARFTNSAFATQTKAVENIEATGHSYGNPTYSWSSNNSSCTATRVCANNSSHRDTETANATSQVTKAATCTEAGEREYTATFKSNAFATQKKTEAIAATGHSFGSVTYTWSEDNSKCTATRTCTKDATHKETETVNTTSSVTTAATCTTKGKTTYTARFTNSAFATQTKAVENIEAKGHSYGNPTYSWSSNNSSCTATRVCSNDSSHKETETANATSQVTKASTCTEAGEREYTATFKSNAFAAQKKTETIAATGHSFGSVTYTWSDDNSKCTATRTCSKDSSHKETETVNATSRVSTAATCTTKGKTTYTAQFTNSAFATQTKTVENIDLIDHSFTQNKAESKYLKTAADCTHKAVYYKSCSVCGAKGTDTFESGEALGHNYQDVANTAVAATCTAAGKKADRKCSRCDSTITGETIAATGHSFTQNKVDSAYLKTAADCTHKAVYYVSCSKCGEKGTNTFESGEALGHNYQDVANTAVAATCTVAGKKADRKCTRCNSTVTGETIAAAGHSYGTVTYTWSEDNSKCTATRTCTKDATHKETETVNSTSRVSTAATCTTKGKTTYTAQFTNSAFASQTKTVENIDTIEHSFTQNKVDATYLKTAADCTHPAVYYKSCSVCGAKGTDTFESGEALGHNYQEVIANTAVEATCTSAGKQADRKCTRCDSTVTGETIPATGHSFTQTTADPKYLKTEADCTHPAVYYKSCSKCGETSRGSGQLEATFESGSSLGHDWDNGVVTREPTDNSEGERTFTCRRAGCGETKKESIGKTNHVFAENWTCDDDYHWHVCTREDCDAIDSYGEHEWIPEVVEQPTCTKTGLKVYTCSVCGIAKEEVLEKTAHAWNETYTVDIPATCTTDGSESIHCSVCDTIQEGSSQVIPSLGQEHKWSEKYTVDKAATYAAAGSKSIHCELCGAKKEGSAVAIAKLTVSGTSLNKLKKAKKAIKVSWKKGSNITGYEIQYSLKSNFKSAKTVAAGAGTTSKTIKKLKAKKKYYVRVRTYKVENGTKYYSAWSAKKSVKTK